MSTASKIPSTELKHFLVIMRDFKDPKALERRLEVRANHMKGMQAIYDQKQAVCAGAILDNHENGKMEGSAVIYRAESEEALRTIIENDPYVKGKVWDWENGEIIPLKMAPLE